MYTPKLMLIVFNIILLVIGVFAIFRGTRVPVPPPARPLEDTTGTKSFSRICVVGGLMLFTVTLFGMWCADSESRKGLVTYKILMFFILAVEVVLIFYYGFDEDAMFNGIKNEIPSWDIKDGNDAKKIDMIQIFFKCCENPNRDPDFIPQSCCKNQRVKCNKRRAHPRLCSTAASHYFRQREARYTWYISQITLPELASVMFADMVIQKITVLRNMLLRK